MKKILLLLLASISICSAQTASVTVDGNGNVLNGKIINFATDKLSINGVLVTAPPADASTTVKGISKLSVAPVSASNPIAVGDNDSRNTNARTPTAHAGTHASAGSDPVSIAASQITSETIATARLGSGTANSGSFLRGDQTWTAVTVPTIASTSNVLKGDGSGNAVAASAGTDYLTPSGNGSGLTALTAANITNSTTVGRAILNLTNPSAITFPQLNADNTVTAQNASAQRTALGVGTGDTPTFTGLALSKATVPAATINFTDPTSYANIILTENGATGTVLYHVGSAFATTNQRNSTVIQNQKTGGAIIWQTNYDGGGILERARMQLGLDVGDTPDPGAGIITAKNGYRVNNAATSGHVLRGNGTNFVDAALVAGDLPDLTATYQPRDSDLDIYAGITPSANVQTLLGAANYAAFRTSLSLVPGTDVVAYGGALGTPSSGTLTNATGLPITGITSSTSAQLRTLLSDENGTGVALFDNATSPTFVTPALGTPSALVLTNATGSPTGISLTKAQLNTIVSDDDPAYLGAANTFTLNQTNSYSGTASTPAMKYSGVPFAGTGTTSFPLVYINDANATASTTLNTAGTYFGVNGDGTQDLMNLLKDGASLFRVYSTGGLALGTTAIDPGAGKVNATQYHGTIFDITSGVSGVTQINVDLRNTALFTVSDFIWKWNSQSSGAVNIFGGGSTDTGIGRNAAGVVEISTGTAGQWGGLKLGTRNTTTNTVTDGLTLGHQLSSGTAAAGLGAGILFNLDSSTTTDQNAGRIYTAWTTATHASRASKVVVQTVNNAGALADALTVNGDGSATLVGNLTATLATAAQPNITALGNLTALTVSGDISLFGTTTAPSSASGYALLAIGANQTIQGIEALGASSTLVISQNASYASGSTWKYISTDIASNYYQSGGTHVFRVAPSGTAGNAITWSSPLSIDVNGIAINGGATIKKVLTATATLDFPSTLAQTQSDLTITVTGAALNDVVALGVPNGSVAAKNESYFAWVSATDTVTVRFNNAGITSDDPASGTFRVMVTQF